MILDTSANWYPARPELELNTTSAAFAKTVFVSTELLLCSWKRVKDTQLSWHERETEAVYKQIPSTAPITERCFSFLEISHQLQTPSSSRRGPFIETYWIATREHIKPFHIHPRASPPDTAATLQQVLEVIALISRYEAVVLLNRMCSWQCESDFCSDSCVTQLLHTVPESNSNS